MFILTLGVRGDVIVKFGVTPKCTERARALNCGGWPDKYLLLTSTARYSYSYSYRFILVLVLSMKYYGAVDFGHKIALIDERELIKNNVL